jgi:hypothetical protein
MIVVILSGVMKGRHERCRSRRPATVAWINRKTVAWMQRSEIQVRQPKNPDSKLIGEPPGFRSAPSGLRLIFKLPNRSRIDGL